MNPPLSAGGRRLRRALAAVVALALVPVAAGAQERYNWSISLLGGLGGAFNEDTAGLSNPTFQLGVGMVSEDSVHVGLRLGEIDFDDGDFLGPIFAPTLTYATIGGEYRFTEEYYDSGVFAGLGFYGLEGEDALRRDESDSGLGLMIGASGEFDLNRRLSFLVELALHVTFLDDADLFATGLGGLAVHF